MDAREVVVTITGAHKAIALAKCIEEGVNHMWTVSAIQMHPKGLIVCDEDSTLELHVKVFKKPHRVDKTVNYLPVPTLTMLFFFTDNLLSNFFPII